MASETKTMRDEVREQAKTILGGVGGVHPRFYGYDALLQQALRGVRLASVVLLMLEAEEHTDSETTEEP